MKIIWMRILALALCIMMLPAALSEDEMPAAEMLLPDLIVESPIPAEEEVKSDVVIEAEQLFEQAPAADVQPSISFSETLVSIGKGDTLDICRYMHLSGIELSDCTFSTSHKNNVSVDGEGLIKGLKRGAANITVTAGEGLSAKIKIKVYDLASSSKISFSPKQLELGEGDSRKVQVNFASGYYGLYTLSSSDTSVVDVDEDGIVYAVGKGDAEVILQLVQKPSVQKKLKVSVKGIPDAIDASQSRLTLAAGQASTAVYGVNPEAEHTSCGYIYASSDEDVVSVDAQTGKLTAVSMGQAVITITADNNPAASAQCRVTVVELAETLMNIGVGETYDIRRLIRYPDGTETGDYTFTTSHKANVTVSKDGIVKGVKRGAANITIKSSDGLSVKVKVKAFNLASAKQMQVGPASLVLGEGMLGKLDVTFPAGYYAMYQVNSSDGNVAAVDRYGGIHALKAGDALLRVSLVNDPETFREIAVRVLPAPERITASVGVIAMSAGQTSAELYGVNPDAANSMCAYVYSSNRTDVVTVDTSTGMLTAIAAGEAEITITAGNNPEAKDVCRVIVLPAPEEISFEGVRKSIGKKEKYQLECTVLPEGAMSSLKYKSSNTSVLTVSADGLLTAKKAGSAVITVTAYNGVKGKITMKVVSAPASVKIKADKNVLGVGEDMQLNTTLSKGSAGACWFTSSDADVVSVDPASGRVQALAAGKCTVHAETYNGKKASFELTVLPAPQEIILSRTHAVIGEGDQLSLSAALNEGAGGGYRFYSSDNSIAVVDENTGMITAIARGNAQITARAYNGVSAAMDLQVIAPPKVLHLSGLEMNADGVYALEIRRGESCRLQLDTEPYSTVSCSYESVNDLVSVTDDGVVASTRSGRDEIIITAYNGVQARVAVKVVTLKESNPSAQVIMHAMGEVDGHAYSNCREAFERNYALGHRMFEVDLAYTSDNELVLWHSWKTNQINSSTAAKYVPTLAEFEAMKIFDAYDSLSYRDLLRLMDQYPDVYFFMDTKMTRIEDIRREYKQMIAVAREMNLEHVLNRMVVMIYSKDMYYLVSDMYPFTQYVYMCYKHFDEKPTRGQIENIMKFCSKNGIDMISMWDYWWNPDYIDLAQQYGLDVNLHTVNSAEQAQEYIQQGVAFITSDYLPVHIAP